MFIAIKNGVRQEFSILAWSYLPPDKCGFVVVPEDVEKFNAEAATLKQPLIPNGQPAQVVKVFKPEPPTAFNPNVPRETAEKVVEESPKEEVVEEIITV